MPTRVATAELKADDMVDNDVLNSSFFIYRLCYVLCLLTRTLFTRYYQVHAAKGCMREDVTQYFISDVCTMVKLTELPRLLNRKFVNLLQ